METKVVIKERVEEVTVRTGDALRSRYSLWVLAGVSFLESALPVPIVTDPFLAAYVLADRVRVKRAVLITTLASLLGGLLAYMVAYAFFDALVTQYLTGDLETQFNDITTEFNKGVLWVTLAGAVTPIPYTLVALGAGFMKANPFVFVAATLIGRGGRYILVGYLTYKFGDQALEIARRHMLLASVVLLVTTVIYFVFFH